MGNPFVDKTIEAMGCRHDDPRLAPRGFDNLDGDSERGECVLIIGLNPAGDEAVAGRERKEERAYLYSIPTKSTSPWIYNLYFRPILKFVDSATDGNAKWPWCNLPPDKLEEGLDHSDLREVDKIIRKEHKARKGNPLTIYIGDMFYYHQTESKELFGRLEKGFDYATYYREMLEAHIKELKNHNKSIKFAYINNAKVSNELRGDRDVSSEMLFGVRVFYGGMLSGGHMDCLSQIRLINEVRRAGELPELG